MDAVFFHVFVKFCFFADYSYPPYVIILSSKVFGGFFGIFFENNGKIKDFYITQSGML